MSVFSDLSLTARTYRSGGYPPFLYVGRDASGHLPVFCYHDIGPEEFEAHLEYLSENGYGTLDGGEIVQALSEARPAKKTVALTFDDGLASVHSVAFPLLKQYAMKAIAYVAPAWIGRPGFLTWDQCREMHDSGLVDIQSHSYGHAALATSLKLTKVWRRSERSPIPWGIPGFEPQREDGRVAWLPVLEGASLFSTQAAIRIPDSLWSECARVDAQCANGKLKAHSRALIQEHASAAAPIQNEELFKCMVGDLSRSRQEIEREIPGHQAEHFAFPWHANSPLAWKAAEQAGFISAAIGLEPTDRSQGRTGKVARILRVNAEFLPCLPGRGRLGFVRILARKAWRRAFGKSVYGIAD